MVPPSFFSALTPAIEEQLEAARESASAPGPEGVHDLRVSTRRLRAALDLWLGCAPGKKLARCRKRLKNLGQRLGSVREADVNLERLADLSLERPADAIAIEFLAASIARERIARMERLRKEKERSDLPGLSEEIRSAIGQARDSESDMVPLAAVARRELRRRRPALEGILEAALAQRSPTALHRLRIELKKFRYSVEMCARAYDGRRVPHLLGRLKELQDALGAAQDAQVLHDLFASRRRELRQTGLAAAERSLLPPMRAVAGILRKRRQAAIRELESSRRESFLSCFEAAFVADVRSRPPAVSGRSHPQEHAASPRP